MDQDRSSVSLNLSGEMSKSASGRAASGQKESPGQILVSKAIRDWRSIRANVQDSSLDILSTKQWTAGESAALKAVEDWE